MTIVGMNATGDTRKLIEELLQTPQFVRFGEQNRLNLNDNTHLFRLALINLIKNSPDELQVQRYKAALLRPGEFDEFLKDWIEEHEITA